MPARLNKKNGDSVKVWEAWGLLCSYSTLVLNSILLYRKVIIEVAPPKAARGKVAMAKAPNSKIVV